jgi:hypothetical protein
VHLALVRAPHSGLTPDLAVSLTDRSRANNRIGAVEGVGSKVALTLNLELERDGLPADSAAEGDRLVERLGRFDSCAAPLVAARSGGGAKNTAA